MSLAVLGKESLDELEGTVRKIFSVIKNQNIPVPTWPESPYGPDELGTRIDLVPVMDMMNLLLLFPLKDYTPQYKTGVSLNFFQ